MKQKMERDVLMIGAVVALALATLVPTTFASASSPRPTAPRSVRARAVNASARVHWSLPASSGSATVKSYVVTSHPSRRTCKTVSRSCVVTGLKAGSSYTFSVVAKNQYGASPSSASNRVTIAPSIASAAKAFLSAQTTLQSSLVTDLTAINAWTASTPAATQTSDLANLQGAFTTFANTLAKDQWPAAARAHLGAYIADVNTLGTAYVALYGATSASNATLLIDTLQADGNKELVGESLVRVDLRLPELISGPVASTTTPVSIGSPQIVHDFYGDTLSVTVTPSIDPATAGAGSGLPDPGYRFVAVGLNLANTDPSNGEVDGNANLAVTIVGSDGVTYAANFGLVSECTNFNFGEFALPTGDTATGCVVFQLPTAVTVKSVQFSLDAGYLDTTAWF
jgi:hypothetical protein